MADVTGALVLASAPGALLGVAGVPLAVRAVLELRAAGIPTLAVFGGPQARRITTLLAPRCPDVPVLATAADAEGLEWPEFVLVVAGDALFDGGSVAPLLTAAVPGAVRAGQAAGASAPPSDILVAVCPGASVPPLLGEVSRATTLRAEALGRIGARVEPPVPLDTALLVRADRAVSPSALERALLDHVARRTTAKDSYLAALIDRRLSRPITRLLLRSPITPSQITVASILLGLGGAAGLATGSYAGRLAGVLALIASIVLDCVDGEVARARYQQSAAGARLDVLGDYTVHLAVFLGLGIGLARQGLPPGGTWAVVMLVSGLIAAMATMHALFVRPALRGGDLHWDAAGLPGTPIGAVVEKLASRDYTYLLLVLALLGHLEWFLYGAAVGSWVFVAALLAYWGYQRRRLVARSPVETA